ncbi:hypothetical protein [Gordonia sp. i37]|uniref:hypothetical protein n=1 Tax=Gordonia sp. i37 TaxID=1961707 RepID=UPI0011186DCE|nr:hypothetical protein [Gordonia sp. i37]
MNVVEYSGGTQLSISGRFGVGSVRAVVAGYLRAPSIALASQGLGLIQLVALLARHGPTDATDCYLYFYNLGLLPVQIILVGVFYPMLINKTDVSKRFVDLYGAITPVLSVATIGLGMVWMLENGRQFNVVVQIGLLCGLNAFVQSIVWFRGICAEASGNPVWISGATLPASFFALVALALPLRDSLQTVVAMLLFMLLGSMALVVIQIRSYSVAGVVGEYRSDRASPVVNYWFLARSTTGYGAAVGIQSLSAQLPPAALTISSIPVKIVGATTTIFVNTLLPRLVHRNSTDELAGRPLLRYAVVTISLVSAIACIATFFLAGRYVLFVVIVAIWLIVSSISSVVTRFAMRYREPRQLVVTVAVPIGVLSLLWLTSLSSGFSVGAVICAYALVDGVTSAVLSRLMSYRWELWLSSILSFALGGLWLASIGHSQLFAV